ncbi:hypothetical protein IAQ67_16375 [Paenibacillus peoriae]|uniref:Uncharacterized protein n=1 Tax=Paenibacillus peoriae TaxID=59893 RepID=A0A7H0Y307_9BACL|nr:hypothetical protein [Paenibacillus peoriae]QNR65465.1 hypothetical protein IAQ67_16375 [Paenibacillus peoriae]
MEMVKYILFSMLDGIAIFTFGFGMYQVKLRDYWIQFIIASLCISVGTCLYKNYGLPTNIAPVVNILFMILFLIVLFRISLLSSLRISGIAFLSQLIIQGLVAVILMFIMKRPFDFIANTYGEMVQLVGDILMVIISLYLRKRALWFTTLPYQYSIKFRLNISNTLLFIASIFGISVMSVSIFRNIIWSLLFWVICFVFLIVIEYRKEIRNEID